MRSISARAAIITRTKYSRPLDESETRFETWGQTVARVIGHQRWLWERAQEGPLTVAQEAELGDLTQLMLDRQSMPAGRVLWLGGTELIRRRESAGFNCAFTEVSTIHDAVDVFWLLLQGCGVGFRPVPGRLTGFSRRVELEVIRSARTAKGGCEANCETYDSATRTWTVAVGDSAEAWAKSIGKLLAHPYAAKKLVLDFSQLRPSGIRLKGYGWVSSGDTNLSEAYSAVVAILNRRAGRLLTKEDIWDVVNWLGTVLSSRRSAQIGIIDDGDSETGAISTRKYPGFDKGPDWYRGQSNNTIVFHEKPTARRLKRIFEEMAANGGSEPGFCNAAEALRRAPWFKGPNPCFEILLGGFCVGGSTPIITANGFGEIKNLVGREVSVWNGETWSSVQPVQTGSNQKLLRVFFGDGSYLDCTHYHRFSVKDRFMGSYTEVQAKDLTGFSKYVIHTEPFRMNYSGRSADDSGRQHAYTCGVIVGDGGIEDCHKIGIDLYGDKMSLPVCGRKSEPLLKPGYNVAMVSVSGLTGHFDAGWLQELKDGSGALDRVFGWGRDEILSFLAGWFDTDGSNAKYGVRLCVAGYDRALRVQLLLTKCGIRSSVNLLSEEGSVTNYGPRSRDSYSVQVTDCRDIPCHRLDTSRGRPAKFKGKYQTVRSVVELPGLHDTYCFEETGRHMAVFGNTLTYQCNLTETNVAAFKNDDRGLMESLALIARANYRQTCVNLRDGVLQSHWHEQNEYLRLCGVGICGVVRRPDLTAYDYRQMKYAAVAGAYAMADELGRERPKNVTTVKPGGTVPKIMDTTEGIKRPDGRFILNRVNFRRDDPVMEKLVDAGYQIEPHPSVGDSCLVVLPYEYQGVAFGTHKDYTPINDESAVSQLERYRFVMDHYCEQNASTTISWSPEEIPAMVRWFDRYWDHVVGVSFCFRLDHTMTAEQAGYSYMPQMVVDESTYRRYAANIRPVDLDDVGDLDSFDAVEGVGECDAGMCPSR